MLTLALQQHQEAKHLLVVSDKICLTVLGQFFSLKVINKNDVMRKLVLTTYQ